MSYNAEDDLVTPDRFLQYLRRQPPDSPCGFPADPAVCPLAQWLREETGCADITVDMDMIMLDGAEIEADHWIISVLEGIDAYTYGTELTASQVMRIVQDVLHDGGWW